MDRGLGLGDGGPGVDRLTGWQGTPSPVSARPAGIASDTVYGIGDFGRMLECTWCRRPFRRRARGPIPSYCSGTCRAAACTSRASLDGRLRQWNRVRAQRRRVGPWLKVCVSCGNLFPARQRTTVTCSQTCRRARAAWRMREGGWLRMRKSRERGLRAERFAPREIFDRDGWRCWLCQEAVEKTLPSRDPAAATLDHVIPISRGGEHTRANVRLAHRICNMRRGAPVDARPTP